MVVTTDEQRLQGIAQLIVHENLLDKEKTLDYQCLARKNKQSLLQYLTSNNILEAQTIASIIAKNYGVPIIDLDSIAQEAIPVSLIDEKLIRRHNVVPLYTHGHHLFLAIEDPGQQASLQEIQFHTGLHTNAVVVESNKLAVFIDKLLQNKNDLSPNIDELEIRSNENEFESEPALNKEDAPVVQFVHKVLIEAIKKNVSDIHFEPYEREYRIRYRMDGILTVVATPPVNLASRITSRIKVMSSLDISERRVPQDGRFKMNLSKTRAIDFRVSTCPTTAGEKVVIRLLDPDCTKPGIEALGLSTAQRTHFLKAIGKPQGMILVTGPTGSGKTVSLYGALNILNTSEVNISTAEDPVEIKIAGVNQVNINPKAGLSFSSTLRSFLRQDPDIIMVGEIRDLETAEIAIKAAQTGHLVLSTLHTNSAAETLTRLLNMGIPSFNIASSISLLVAQRLVRVLCEHCKVVRDDVTPQGLQELGFSEAESFTMTTYKPAGCSSCTQGYRGRVGLFEVMPMSKTLGQLIMTGANSEEILKQAQIEGMLTIYQSGMEKIKNGQTSIEEVNRVTVE